jgi:hypothetical protein
MREKIDFRDTLDSYSLEGVVKYNRFVESEKGLLTGCRLKVPNMENNIRV